MYYKKYTKVAKVQFQNIFEYRFDILTNMIFSYIPLLANFILWFSIYNDGKNISLGYSLKEIITYYFIIFVVDNLVNVNVEGEVSNYINTGEINKYLIKPINFMIYMFFKAVPYRLIFIISSIVPTIILGVILNKFLELPGIYNLLLFSLSIALGYLINFLIKYFLGLLSFYFSQIRSLYLALEMIRWIVSGSVIPISIFPKYIYNILSILPFQFMAYFPATIFQERFLTNQLLWLFSLACGWIVLLYLICQITWRLGIKKYSAFGG